MLLGAPYFRHEPTKLPNLTHDENRASRQGQANGFILQINHFQSTTTPSSPSQPVMFSRQVVRTARAAAPQRAFALRSTSARTYAVAANAGDGQPPVTVFGVDGTYASALVCPPKPSL